MRQGYGEKNWRAPLIGGWVLSSVLSVLFVAFFRLNWLPENSFYSGLTLRSVVQYHVVLFFLTWGMSAFCFYLGRSFVVIYALFLALETTVALLCNMSWEGYECICLACFPAVYAVSAFLFRCRYRRGAWLVKLSAGAVLLLAALQYGIYISYILRFGGRPSASAVMAVLGTHPAEARGFLLDQFGLKYVALAVGIAITSWAVPCFISERAVSLRRRKYAAFLLVLSLGLALAYRHKAESYGNLFFDFRSGVRQYRLAVKSMSLRRADRSHEAAALHTVKRGTGEVCLVVVGESANRTHMACYGYDRPTTPWLSGESRAICLERGYSCMTHTEPAVTMALSRLSNYEPGLNERAAMMPMIADSLSLIDFLRSAGVKTYWLSGQQRIGNYNNFLTGKLAVCADKMKFLCDEPIVSGSGHFDGELTGYLREILQQFNKLRSRRIW